MVRGECWERLYIYLLYRHPIYSLYIYTLPFLLFRTKTTAFRDYFCFTYYTRGHVGIQVIPAP